MTGKSLATIIIALAIVIVGWESAYIVSERERAVVLRFGQVKNPDVPAGLHFKAPFIDKVKLFDGRLLTLDAAQERFFTQEKKALVVDSFVKWRIADVQRFYTATSGNIIQANRLLSQLIESGLRNLIAQCELKEVVSGKSNIKKRSRFKCAQETLVLDDSAVQLAAGVEIAKTAVQKAAAKAAASAAEEEPEDLRDKLIFSIKKSLNEQVQIKEKYGIEIVDVRFKRIDLPEQVSDSVYERMITEREKEAQEIRSFGKQKAEEIRAEADRERRELLAKAYQIAEQLRGEGDQEAAAVYAEAYGSDQEFYNFYRSLQAYRQAFKQQGDIMVLKPESDFFKYLKTPHAITNTSSAENNQ
ncbi:protease modulator HflC [Endozoicomonas sp. SM1973]|uniref:Protein HflC n=1 Tax=Spartinivicinus marinus TaxID=2994442 RepID=A0A853IAY1_9GAMM|nr:protease modulator HflC [Spartinivicinus marinus]MCX4027605.1 protease modulator HflC [Spartinivicinus marinus]NYZ66697.1 protease modulator HflC [Spartinivicinus marinus]